MNTTTAVWVKADNPKLSGEYFTYCVHENDMPEDKPTKCSIEYDVEFNKWDLADGWKVIQWLSESPSPTEPGTAEEINQLAEQHADEYYDRDSDRNSAMPESIQWENRKYNFIEGYNAAMSAYRSIPLEDKGKEGWIRVEDRLPDAGQKVDLWIVPEDEEKSYRMSWTWEKESTSKIKINNGRVTHWMPFYAPAI